MCRYLLKVTAEEIYRKKHFIQMNYIFGMILSLNYMFYTYDVSYQVISCIVKRKLFVYLITIFRLTSTQEI